MSKWSNCLHGNGLPSRLIMSLLTADGLLKDLKNVSSPKKAKASSWFFKTGKGQYGEGDVFIGVTVPEQRAIAKKYKDLELSEVIKLLQNKIHECRLTALFILVSRYKSDKNESKKIVDLYLKNIKYINNWDLVDSSAPYILGHYLLEKDKSILYKYAVSKDLWKRRISILSTAWFIKEGEYLDTLKISETLLSDKEDLIHKAVGWMLREVGKKSLKNEVEFLDKFASIMPRTMLRYAIEKFPPKQRKYYLNLV